MDKRRIALIRNGIVENVVVVRGDYPAPPSIDTVVDAGEAEPGSKWDGRAFAPPDPDPEPPPDPLALIAIELDQVAEHFKAAADAVRGAQPAVQADELEAGALGVERAAAIAREAAVNR